MKINVFPDASGEFRWHATSRNGRILADSAEGYSRKASAERAAKQFVQLCTKLTEDSVTVLDVAPAAGSTAAAKKASQKLTPVPAKKAAAKKAPAKKAPTKKRAAAK